MAHSCGAGASGNPLASAGFPPCESLPSPRPVMSSLEAVIFERLAAAGPGRSVSPEEVARAADPERWRSRLPQVRATAIGLARAGRLVILLHEKTATPESFK